MTFEVCCECSERTGRAGRAEDSLYFGGHGPFCESCYDEYPDTMTAEFVKLRAEVERLRLERDAALALLREASVPDCEPQDYKDTLVDFVLPNGDEGYDLTEASLKKSKGEK